MATTTSSSPIKLNTNAGDLERSRAPWRDTLKALLRNRSARIGMVLIGFLLFLAIFAPILAPYNPDMPMIGQRGETTASMRQRRSRGESSLKI